MANQSPLSTTAIVNPHYCAPATHPIDLIIIKEKILRDNFTITYINDNIIFTVKSSHVTLVTPGQHRFLYMMLTETLFSIFVDRY
ncbi:hypothetical protein P8452_38887 [Trifolium repens]|nr:hypothetical protein P8452_38887 [Trifolium repens]